jgi:hypothetical protein
MWLLDANMDIHLVAVLTEMGVTCEAATRRGWAALDNGALVSASAEAGFTCLLTQDQLFAESASRALHAFPNFAVVVVHLPQRPWQQYVQDFRAAWNRGPVRPLPGQVVHWPGN